MKASFIMGKSGRTKTLVVDGDSKRSALDGLSRGFLKHLGSKWAKIGIISIKIG